MVRAEGLICGNWGGTSLRAYCIDKSGELRGEVRRGDGINKLNLDQQKQQWFEITKGWPDYPHLICGSAGSNLGWLHTGYVGLPATAKTIADGIEWRTVGGHQIGIIPGIKATNPLGEPDTMRSEETELIGFMAGRAAGETRIVCLPGTHNKWAQVSGGAITQFFTSLTGEAFNALNNGTVVTRGSEPPRIGSAFEDGVRLGLVPKGTFLQKLYSVRARQINETLAAADSASFLSGLIIGTDILGARQNLGEALGAGVTVIGGQTLSASFARALAIAHIEYDLLESDRACIAGFVEIARKTALF
jgi:2-dehydro-3-deoxygalactonokinase